jgi:tricarballylate dehydrogenase
MEIEDAYDVIVVGGGNAALCAALSARELDARVLLLERAPEEERGGNSAFTEGLMRFVYDGPADIQALSPDIGPQEMKSDFGAYSEENFFDDMARITLSRTDPDLCEVLVRQSQATLHWMRKHGVRFVPQFGRQAFKVDGKFKFSGGTVLAASGGGRGLVDALYQAATRAGIHVVYDAWVKDLLVTDHGVSGVFLNIGGIGKSVAARSVVLACGGFEANAAWRAKYLGPGWDCAKVRGTKYNTGDGLAMALRIGAQPAGNWSGCHSVGWERYAEDFGNFSAFGDYQRNSYQFSIIVNTEGKRFLDEGADFRTNTYAKYGRMILQQPGQCAWQIYDATVTHLLQPEYRARRTTKVVAQTIEELASKIDEVDGGQLLMTIHEFNAAVRHDIPFRPMVKDGRGTVNLKIAKSNWANPIERPPFEAYPVTCGITFTFGGLGINARAQVKDMNHRPIDGLYAAGEMVGGLFYFNYPGATGLTSGAVFGRLAGQNAAIAAKL